MNIQFEGGVWAQILTLCWGARTRVGSLRRQVALTPVLLHGAGVKTDRVCDPRGADHGGSGGAAVLAILLFQKDPPCPGRA